MPVWNPWHGCTKLSPGCLNCYVYRIDAHYGRDATKTNKTGNFNWPLRKDRQGNYKLQSNEMVFTCMTSDFFIDAADEWRPEIWDMMHFRDDLQFGIITKRVDRIADCLPDNWGDGYSNVTIFATCENQEMADYRLPIMLELPLKKREIIEEPMLEQIDLRKYLATGKFRKVTAGGESGSGARILDYKWIEDSARQCEEYGVKFCFKQTGAVYINEYGETKKVARKYQMPLAEAYGISTEKLVPTMDMITT